MKTVKWLTIYLCTLTPQSLESTDKCQRYISLLLDQVTEMAPRPYRQNHNLNLLIDISNSIKHVGNTHIYTQTWYETENNLSIFPLLVENFFFLFFQPLLRLPNLSVLHRTSHRSDHERIRVFANDEAFNVSREFDLLSQLHSFQRTCSWSESLFYTLYNVHNWYHSFWIIERRDQSRYSCRFELGVH